MKKIGIIGAMELEVEELKSQMEEVCVKEKASMEFYQGTLNGKEVVVVRSGIGKVMQRSAHRFLWMIFRQKR